MIRYVSSRDAPDTVLMQFRVVRGQRAVIDGDTADDPETGRSPIDRWLAWAFDYDDFVSNHTGATGYEARLIVPRGTIAMQCFARVDTLFAGTGHDDIDIGDGNDPDGWGDAQDWSSTGVKRTADCAYNDYDTDTVQGTSGFQYYSAGDTIDVLFKNATAPTAGRAIVFLECISYHEDLNAEW